MVHYPQKGRTSRVQVGLGNLGFAGLAFGIFWIFSLCGFISILDTNILQAAPLANRVYCLLFRIYGSRFLFSSKMDEGLGACMPV